MADPIVHNEGEPEGAPEGRAGGRGFLALNIAVLTVSDSRTEETDKSGRLLAERLEAAGHRLYEKAIVPDDVYRVRAVVARWCAEEAVHVVITTGGTGVTGRDGTPEAVRPLFPPGSGGQDPELTARMLSALADEAVRLLLDDPVRYPPERLVAQTRWFLDRVIDPQQPTQRP